MPNVVVAFLLAAGGGAWSYTKINAKTGGNTQNALVVGGVVGALLFVVMMIVLALVDKSLA